MVGGLPCSRGVFRALVRGAFSRRTDQSGVAAGADHHGLDVSRRRAAPEGVGQCIFELLMRLESQQIEYDLGSEDILNRHGSIGASGLRVGQRDYAVVIVPPL